MLLEKQDRVQWVRFNHRWNIVIKICTISQWWFLRTRWRGEFLQRYCSFYYCLLENVYPNSDMLPSWSKNHWRMVKMWNQQSISDLAEVGFKVRAVITDDHSSNVNAFTRLHEILNGDNKTFIKHHAFADFARKTYLFFDVIHLFKNIRSNLPNQKKYVFPLFQFDLFHYAIHVPYGYISWHIFHEVHERDENLQVHLRKAPKITYQMTHPSNNKQSVRLTLAIFQECITAAMKSYFPNRLDAVNFLALFYKVFVINNFKQPFKTSNQLGNAAVEGDHKPEFLLLVADWVETWWKCPSFPLTKQTSHALVTTPRCIANLIDDLLNENYD